MKNMLWVIVVLGLLASSCTKQDVAIPDGSKAFLGATLFDGTGADPTQNSLIVVRNGRIEYVGTADGIDISASTELIDVSGMTILPGFINTHGHINGVLGLEDGHYNKNNLERQLRLYARYGITTVNSLGGDGEEAVALRNAEDDTLQRARIKVAGTIVTGDTIEKVQSTVDENANLGVNFIKIRVDDNLGTTKKMLPNIYQAVIDQAHKQNLKVASHLFYLDDAKSLLNAGTDFVAHSIRDVEADTEVIELMKEKSVCYCPTLTREISTFVYESEPDFFSDPFFLKDADPKVLEQLKDPKRMQAIRESPASSGYKKALSIAMPNLKKIADGGATIAFGTDTGPAGRFQGYFEHMELNMMAEAGLSPRQIIMSATGDAAECLGYKQIGTLESNKWADFIVLRENPLDDIKNMRSIDSVWIAGNQVLNDM